MKKFTNLNKIENQESKIVKTKINKLVEKLISLNLFVSYSGDSNNIIGKKVEVKGIDKLVEKLNLLIEKNNLTKLNLLIEQLKYSNIRNNQELINNEINNLNESKHDTIIFSPEDIFDKNDYTKSNKQFIIESLNSIPSEYLYKINRQEVFDYFSNENKISIIYEGLDKGWILSFKKSNKYGTSVDDENTKYKKFIKENADFIADFIAATANLIGNKHLKLDNKLF